MLSLPRRAQVSIFLLCASVLFLEIILTRLFTALIFDRLYYLPISMAMLGLSGGGLRVFFRRTSSIEHDAWQAVGASLVFAALFLLTLVVSNSFLRHADENMAIGVFLRSRFTLVLIYGGLSIIPFYAMGVLMAALLRDFVDSINLLYGADLIGATIGAVLTVPVLNYLNSAVFLLIVPIFLSLLLLFWVRASARRRLWLVLITQLCVVTLMQTSDVWHMEARTLRTTIDAPKDVKVRWSARAYMELYRRNDSTWVVNQDHGSTVFVRPYDRDATACASGENERACQIGFSLRLVRAVRSPKSALILAAGTGQQMIQSHLSGIVQVVGVEVNPFLRSLVNDGDSAANLDAFFALPNVDLVIDEARDYLRRSNENFDLIMVPSVFAAYQQSVALHSYLLTREAVEDYVRHLSDRGILLFTMPMIPQFAGGGSATSREYLSLIDRGLAAAGLGGAPNHVIGVLSDGSSDAMAPPLQYVLVSKAPWTSAEIASLANQTESTTRNDVLQDLSWSNEQWRRADPSLSNPHYRVVSWSGMVEQSGLNKYGARLITDDFPWLFERPISLASLFEGSVGSNGDPKALQVFGNVLALFGVSALIGFPLQRNRQPGGKSVQAVAGLSFFFWIGCGFMFLEIGVMDKLALVFGYSSYNIALSLAPLLVGAGLGSFLSKTLLWKSTTLRVSRLNVCLAALVATMVALYWYAQRLLVLVMALSTPLQYAYVAFFLLLVGLFMGVPFPQGLAVAAKRDVDSVPWAWGLNGAGSVLAINLVGLLHGSFTLSSTFLISAVSYLLSVMALNGLLLPTARGELGSVTKLADLSAVGTAVDS